MGSFSCSVYITLVLGFTTGRDSLVSRDKGTKVSLLSRDKGTTGQAQNLAMGGALTGFWQSRDRKKQNKKLHFLTFFCPRPSKDRGLWPRIFASAFVPRQRDMGTRFFCPGTKGQQDIPGLSRHVGNPSSYQVNVLFTSGGVPIYPLVSHYYYALKFI